MKLECTCVTGRAIPLEQRYLHEVDETSYLPLKVGDSYTAFAMMMIKNRMDVLVCAENGNPLWAPVSLFSVSDASISRRWHFRTTRYDDAYGVLWATFEITVLFGYPRLVDDFAHYVGVVEGNENELRRFYVERDYQA